MLGNKKVENCHNVWKTQLSFRSDQFFGQLENYVKRVFSVIIVDSADDVKNLLWNLFRNFIFEICRKTETDADCTRKPKFDSIILFYSSIIPTASLVSYKYKCKIGFVITQHHLLAMSQT